MSWQEEHQVALWAGVAAFFGSLVTIGVIDLLDPNDILQFISAVIIAAITAGAVYSKERLSDAKKQEKRKPPRPPTTLQKGKR